MTFQFHFKDPEPPKGSIPKPSFMPVLTVGQALQLELATYELGPLRRRALESLTWYTDEFIAEAAVDTEILDQMGSELGKLHGHLYYMLGLVQQAQYRFRAVYGYLIDQEDARSDGETG